MESQRISHELARVLQALWFLLVSGVCLWGIVESLCSLSQVLDWRSSRHALYALTGHFQNPGPFGGFIACVMVEAGAWLLRYSTDRQAASELTGPDKCVFRANPRAKGRVVTIWPDFDARHPVFRPLDHNSSRLGGPGGWNPGPAGPAAFHAVGGQFNPSPAPLQ